MSHFAVLVIGSNVEEQLAPYHEFECTGFNDQYVQDIDHTPQALSDYNSSTVTRIRLLDSEQLYDPDDDKFYREPTSEELVKIRDIFGNNKPIYYTKDWNDGKGERIKILEYPMIHEKCELPTSSVKSFLEFAQYEYNYKIVEFGSTPDIQNAHKFGYILLNKDGSVDKIINRTNPSAKWDWYVIGGRWTGYFKLKSFGFRSVGEPGVMTDFAKDDWVDSARKGNIDFNGMIQIDRENARERWKEIHDIIDCSNFFFMTWEEAKNLFPDISEAREFYNNQPIMKELHRKKLHLWNGDDIVTCTEEEWLQRAENASGIPFAIVKNGKWYERGQMGWWAIVSNEKDVKDWQSEVRLLINELSDDAVLTIVDCHI